MITLSNIYTREKTLFYFTMWNDSDRKGYLDYLGHKVRNNLFIVKPAGEKGSVWYDLNELGEIERKTKEKVKDQEFVASLKARLDTEWSILLPYLIQTKHVESGEDLEQYYTALVSWWSAMNTAFGIPDMLEADEATRRLFLSYRIESEKYTEQMNKVFVNFWTNAFPEYAYITFFVAPMEAVQYAKGIFSNNEMHAIRERVKGCIFLNETLYPISALKEELANHNLVLEHRDIDAIQQINGSVAYKVSEKIVGPARVISSFKDMGDFKQGEVLVTEMTNPDYVPIMKLAAAVVTDEGGITCHAAIASRELKVPCVIGTKIATKAITTGDTIEVDASTGVVRIIR